MKKAGGIVALVAGVFGTLAAMVTLLIGGMGSALGSNGAGTVVALGWGGVAFSFATIVLGAVAIGAKSRVPGALLIACALLGAILGGTLVAVFMALALVGGILAVVGVKKPSIGGPGSAAVVPPPPPPGTGPVPPPPTAGVSAVSPPPAPPVQ